MHCSFPKPIIFFTVLIALQSCATVPQQKLHESDLLQSMENGFEKSSLEKETLLLAEEATKNFKYEEAARYYQQLLAKRPDQYDYLLGYAEILRFLSKDSEAFEIYNKILKNKPDDVNALEGKGLISMKQGRFEEAMVTFTSIMEKDASRWQTINAIGVALTLTERPKEALEYYQFALSLSPHNSVIYNNIALNYGLMHEYNYAIENFYKALTPLTIQNPKLQRIELNMALVYALMGKIDHAERLAQKYLQGPVLYNNLGLYAHLAKDDVQARSYLNRALLESPVYYQKAWDNLQAIRPQ